MKSSPQGFSQYLRRLFQKMNEAGGFPALAAVLALTALFLLPKAYATVPLDTPVLSVDESAFGTANTSTKGKAQQSIQSLRIHIFCHTGPRTANLTPATYEVQCFFLKRGKTGDLPSVDDAVIFETTTNHGWYEVASNPMQLSPASKTSSKKSGKKSSKKSKSKKKKSKSKSPSKTTAPESPRAGYIVRVLGKGVILRQECSSHLIEQLLKQHPDYLDQAMKKVSIRHLESQSLQKNR